MILFGGSLVVVVHWWCQVLADAVGMPCRIARGCQFCHMDDGASCLVLASDDRQAHSPSLLQHLCHSYSFQ